jgi:hypothetical protein
MSLQTGDILLERSSGQHLLLYEPDVYEDEYGLHDVWIFLVLETGRQTWWYADYLEDEVDYMRAA